MPGSHRRPAARESAGRGLVFALGLSAMIVSMMQTLIVPILTVVQKDLSLSSSTTSWLATSTLLSAAVFTPVLGRLGDMHGKRPVLLGVLGVTVAGSVLAACTSSLPLLLLARVMQGASTAIFPLALSVLRDELPARRLPGAMGLVSGTLAFGSGLALVGAGLLSQGPHPDYHRVFWLATVLSLIALATAAIAVPPSPSSVGGRTDWLGVTTLAGAMILLLLPISQGGAWGWTSARCLGLLGGAVLLTVVWVLIERRVRQPLVDMRMFVLRPVVFTNLAGVLLGFGMFTQFIGISYLVQTPHSVAGYGFSASVLDAAVVYLLPGTIASLIAAQFGGVLVRRIGARITLAAGAGSGVLGFGWLALSHASPGGVVAAGLLTGVAVSFGFATLPAFIVAGVPAHQSGIANGINSIARSLGSSLGSAVITAILSAHLLTGLPPGTHPLPGEGQYTLSFTLGACAFALVALIALTGLRIKPAPHHVIVPPAGAYAAEVPSRPGG
ncbi:MFS transporter [Streptomyces sp. NPDC006704]|uniref:MFS transporter n=1 Tax=Streptomyces sp. NPDC006704 TaxID=3364760 RepID=UPI0036A75701